MCHPHFHTPADLSPLSYGTGLALGLMLILGLPRAPAVSQSAARAELRPVDPPHVTQTVVRYRPDLSLALRQAERDQPVMRRR